MVLYNHNNCALSGAEGDVPMKEPEHYLTPILIQLYNSTLSHLDRFKDSMSEMSKKIRIQQFQVITLGSSRRMGHTQATLSLIKDRKLKTIYICGNSIQKKNVQQDVKEYQMDNVFVYGSYSDMFYSVIGTDLRNDIDLVVIDESIMSQNKRDQILDIICKSKSDPIILRMQPKF